MTVKPVRSENSQERISGSDFENVLSPKILVTGGSKVDRSFSVSEKKSCGEDETDQESWGSTSEEMESPKSVAKVERCRKKVAWLHSQVLRIREEDSHLGEDIGEGLSTKDKVAGQFHHLHHYHVAAQMDVMIFSRPILPSSPLSRKAVIKALH